jgi:hypothetical protein
LLGLSLLAVAAHCRRHPAPEVAADSPPPPRPLRLSVVEVVSATVEPASAGDLDRAALQALITRKLEASGLLALPSPSGPPAPPAPALPKLRVLLRAAAELVEVGDKGKVQTSIALRLDTRPSDAPGALNEELAGSGEAEFSARAGTPRRAVVQSTTERTLGDLLDGFLARERLRIAAPAELHALIRQPGPLREDAVRQIGSRRLRGEVPYLLELLHDDTESLRDAALGALLALREPRAVRELTHSRSMTDRREMRKILDALAALGGDEARDYLSFVAEGHTDDEIRTMAAEARDRLERRRDAGAAR